MQIEDNPFANVRTRRLSLRPAAESDLAELHRLYADPEVWRADPVSRHESLEQTAALIERSREAWRLDGLGMWVARNWDTTAAAELVGFGGCNTRHDVAWNVGFRLARAHWGQGLAQEIVGAGMDAARVVRPALPFIAYLLEGNARSQRAVERAGFQLVWRGPDAGNPDPGAVRLLYADRPLDASLVTVLTAD
jgi:RimJ/RimL family protein N-acetyltransferase